MKRILLVILCTVVVVTVCVNNENVFASSVPIISCESKECNPGDTVTVSINIRNNPGIMYLELTPEFAHELGEPQAHNGTLLSDFTNAKQYVWTDEADITSDGELLTLTFRIPESTTAGSYPISFIFRAAYNYNENPVTFSVAAGAVRVKQSSQTAGATIVCGSGKCVSGGSISVDIAIEENPGIMYLELTPIFAVELEEPDAKNGVLFSDFTKGKQYIWTADSDVISSGKLLTVTFNIPKTTNAGDYPIDFVFRTAYDYDENNVYVCVESGTVTVSSETYIPGDINGDGQVDNKDLTRLFQYLSNWEVAVNEDALDVNGDNSVDNKDLTRLFQYLSNWDVEIS